jgi:uncharacterized protein
MPKADTSFISKECLKNAVLISKNEGDVTVVNWVLLHDIADSKFHDGDETIGPRIAREFFRIRKVDEEIITAW